MLLPLANSSFSKFFLGVASFLTFSASLRHGYIIGLTSSSSSYSSSSSINFEKNKIKYNEKQKEFRYKNQITTE